MEAEYMRKKILAIIIDALRDLNDDIQRKELESPSEETRLFGIKVSMIDYEL